MKANQVIVLFVSVVFTMVTAAFATDGTFLSGKTKYEDAASWQDGTIAYGADATMSLAANVAYDTTITTNIVLGHIVYPGTGVAGLQFNLNSLAAQTTVKDYGEEWYTHLTWNAQKAKVIDPTLFGVNTNTLTLKCSGTAPATIERLSPSRSDYQECNTHRMTITMPTRLESDLVLRANARYTTQLLGDQLDVNLAGDITEVGGKRSVILDHTHRSVVSYFGGDNDFTGNLVISGGVARAGQRDGHRRSPCRAFGHDNLIVLASTNASVNLHGQVFGTDQKLIVGAGVEKNTSFYNVVYPDIDNRDADPAHRAVWAGPVEMTGDFSIGGSGPINVTGNITEKKAGASIWILGSNPVRFTGTNTYSGSTILGWTAYPNQTAFFSARPESVGTGPVVFNGGFWQMYAADDADVTANEIIVSNGAVKVELKGDFVYTPKGRLLNNKSLWKDGVGTLRLKAVDGESHLLGNDNRFAGGETILDYADGVPVSFSDWNNNRLYFYNNARLVVTNLSASAGTAIRIFECRSFSKLRIKNATAYFWGGSEFTQYPWSNLYYLEEGGPFGTGINLNGNEAKGSTAYPGNWIWRGTDFVTKDTSVSPAVLKAYADYKTTWAEANTNDVVDLTLANVSELAARTKPVELAMIRVDGLGSEGDEVVVTFPEGTNVLYGGTILITPSMGSRNVRFTGGALLHPGENVGFRILNYSTGTVTVENDIIDSYDEYNRTAATSKYAYNTTYWVTNPKVGTSLVTDGNGKVVLKGDNRFTGYVTLLGGETQFVGTESLGAYGVEDGIDNFCGWMRYIHLVGGAKVSFKGDVKERAFADATYPEAFNLPFVVHPDVKAAEISLPEATDSLTLTRMYSSIMPLRGAEVKVTGLGRINYQGTSVRGLAQMDRNNAALGNYFWNNSTSWTQVPEIEYGETTLTGASQRVFGTCRLNAKLNGTTLKGASLLNAAWMTDGNQSKVYDHTFKRRFEIGEKGATFDLMGASVMATSVPTPWWNASAFFKGTGPITITNSVPGSGNVNWNNFRSEEFEGKWVMATDFSSSSGLMTPYAGLAVAKGATIAFGTGLYDAASHVEAEYLEGEGTLKMQGGNNYARAIALIGGGAAGETHEFKGTFVGEHSGTSGDSGSRGELVKVGRNTQVLSGMANVFTAVTTVRDGVLQLNADSADTTTAYPISVGDNRTPADGTPTLLAGNGAGIGQRVIIPSLSPSTALPAVGGASDGVCYSNVVTVYRSFALVANAGTTTFTKAIKGGKEDLTVAKLGAGKVVLEAVPEIDGVTYDLREGELEIAGDVTATDLVATMNADGIFGTLVVDGTYAIPNGTTLTISAAELDRKKTYELVSASSITGRFVCDSLPAGWELSYAGGKVTLRKSGGLVVIFR